MSHDSSTSRPPLGGVDSESWHCARCGATMIGHRPDSGLCPGCARPAAVRAIPADDLAGSVRQSLGDLARVSGALDGGAAPGLDTARLLEAIARELRAAAAVCGGYASGFTA